MLLTAETMATSFIRLNSDWNAEPNAPDEHVTVDGSTVILEFNLAGFFHQPWHGKLVFEGARRYRLGETNDEGWYLGQCRFSRLAPAWGEFYEVDGDLLESAVNDWVFLPNAYRGETRHFLFYLRDSTFECDAAAYHLIAPGFA
jgi:hypothetical protein